MLLFYIFENCIIFRSATLLFVTHVILNKNDGELKTQFAIFKNVNPKYCPQFPSPCTSATILSTKKVSVSNLKYSVVFSKLKAAKIYSF